MFAPVPTGRSDFVSLIADLRDKFSHLVRELAKFGSVGAMAFVITWAGTNALHGLGWLKANTIATVLATTFAYFANRYWTFRHRDQSGLGREYVLFFILNGIGLVITLVFIGFTNYTLGKNDILASNAALFVGTAVATLFRYWAYKKWVFLPTDAPAVEPATGLPEPAPQAHAVLPRTAVANGTSSSNGAVVNAAANGSAVNGNGRPHPQPSVDRRPATDATSR